ncbi:hypothetical protein PHLGIDRAFT_130799 [Phlebiopsis gigantea 11061_1 CR5-6]|uniref:tyrosinase n=1 Tax=Phlebiopsis gigantea (strain 11061_1 CR5-6) TaxID=745531 RepID=A0A0C3NCS7_PHLG1|nr:hypothetical protein PHLGIDRAFT_130799 [Phlebiopsis gigantea 11061_1 CR5-6]
MSQRGPFIISGAVGGAPNRLEIYDFVKNDKFFSLYIQALTEMSKMSQDDLLSFFQIGGIHGLPYVSWNESGNKEVGDWGGYCTHGSNLFPTWHRPYVSTYEQLLQQHAIEIAKTYTVDREGWNKAAQDMRTPYWDWAATSVPPKEVSSLEQVEIVRYDGARVKVPNPLIRYHFHPIDPSFPSPYDQWQITVRHPRPATGPNSKSNVPAMERTLRANYDSTRTNLYTMFRSVHNWPDFSNHTAAAGKTVANSLEGIHDNMHVYIGGSGQMGDPAVAGFDPIFFIHHANVDRLLALWSAVNPDVWVVDGPAVGGTWTIPADATVGDKTDLTPFWNAQTTYWESAEVTGTTKFGYTYPEFNGLDLADKQAVKRAITQKINELYGFTDDDFSAQSIAAPPASDAQQTVQTRDVDLSTPAYLDWTARVHVKKYEIGGSFSILLFVGEVPANPEEWHASPSFAGSYSGFVNSATEHCANCRNQRAAGVVLEGFVHLNNAIKKKVSSFAVDVVEPLLQEQLHWRILKVSGEVVDPSSVPSLEISVFHLDMDERPFPDPTTLPTHGDPQFHHRITRGRPGGADLSQ